MLTALYYPHTSISNEVLLKNALLLWDQVECIVPGRNWKDPEPPRNRTVREAQELILDPIVPSEEERVAADREIRAFVEGQGGLTSILEETVSELRSAERERRASRLGRRFPDYLIYPEKFLGDTWQFLKQKQLARWDAHTSDWGVPPVLGLMMMSLLADACAGTQKQKVTDRARAYSWIEEKRAQSLGATYVKGLDVSDIAPSHDRLITLSLEVLDVRSVPLDKLVALRKREIHSGSSDYRAMRLRYLECLNRYVERIRKEAKTGRDVKEIERQFKAELKLDLAELKKELNLASVKALFSKEVALSAVAVAGSLVEPVTGLTNLAMILQGIGVAPLIKTRAEYRAARSQALQKHPISWLYFSRSGRLTIR